MDTTFSNQFAQGQVTTKESLGITDEMVEAMYGQAFRLYNTGKYEDAVHLFRLLIMLDPANPKYTFGLAACMHLLKEYRNAIELYTMSSALDPESPIAPYHLSDCYLQIKDKLSALIALEMAIKRAGDSSTHRVLRDRSQMTLDNIRKELEASGVLKEKN